MAETTVSEKKSRGRMPLRPLIPDPTEFSEEKIPGAVSFQVVLKALSGMEVITTNAERASFSLSATWSVFAILHTFVIKPFLGSFEERLSRFSARQKREVLTGHVSPLFTEDRLPIEGDGIKLKVTRPVQPYQVHLVRFSKRVSSEEAISLLYGEKLWMRPALFEELIDFGINYPHVQTSYRITALGSSIQIVQKDNNGGQAEVGFVPSLSLGRSGTTHRRMLTATPWRTLYPIGEMFLAVSRWPGTKRTV